MPNHKNAFLKISSVFITLLYQNLFSQTTPAEGIRKNTPTVHAFTNVKIVTAPGKVIEKGTLVIRDGIIEAVGTNINIPADARIWKLDTLIIYPGLIESYSDIGIPKDTPSQESQEKKETGKGSTYWNSYVRPETSVEDIFAPDLKTAEKFRSVGFTTAFVVPTKNIFKGSSAFVSLGDGTANDLLIKGEVAQHIALTTSGSDAYPNSLMGAIALIRQVFVDAQWYGEAMRNYEKQPVGQKRPEFNETLEEIDEIFEEKKPFVFEVYDDLNFLRAVKIAKEFSLKIWIRGSGNEYKRLDAIKQSGVPVILPVVFPDVPSVQTHQEALNVSYEELRHWYFAPENPKRLQSAGVTFAFTSSGLKDVSNFHSQIKTIIERGLSENDALSALTTTPAKLFGVDKQLGTIETGKIANFIITNGKLFNEKTKILEVWIDGIRYEIKSQHEIDPRGMWKFELKISETQKDTGSLEISGDIEKLEGKISAKGKSIKLSNISLVDKRIFVSFTGDSMDYKGVIRLAGMIDRDKILGTGELADGKIINWTAERKSSFFKKPSEPEKKPEPFTALPLEINYPNVSYGRPKLPEQPEAIFVKGATIWTMGPQGKLENADIIIQKGKILQVGKNLTAPKGAKEIDAKGKHLTPGLIDAHSHTAASGSVNEGTQAITAEVRIGDIIDSDEIAIYRELAGGLTTANVLHGSANPIGGQNQVIKLRWGVSPEEMKFEGAMPGIKFALGENVKQSNWGDRFTTRYPQTRMGVEQIIRDEFRSALDYKKIWDDYNAKKNPKSKIQNLKSQNLIPPRRDLELETIVEILEGKRLVHCHSYRQDELLMILRVAESFGFKIATLQHVLDGYKVADQIAKHGAGASTFSDWWAYKFEVYDATPYNGALMNSVGVIVSFNSDSDEMARRMNTESAKAIKYGGLNEESALKFVTINPAKQLRIDNRVGSIEVGKDADFVIWSENPLSTYTICEETWIDGRKYFDRKEDKEMQEKIVKERAMIIQRILEKKDKK